MGKTKPKPKPKPQPKRDYQLVGGIMLCQESNLSKCTVDARLWQGEISPFHDAMLEEATIQINEIIEGLDRGNADRDRHLCFIDVGGQRLLVWTQHGDIVPSDDEDIAEVLKLKVRTP